MTTPTPHGAPELPVVAYLTEHYTGHMLWLDRAEAVTYCDDNDPEPLVKLSDARAAIQQAAGAVPEVVAAWQAREILDEDWSDWREYRGEDLERWRSRVARRPDLYEIRALYTSPLGLEAACVSQNAESEPQTILTRTDDPQPEAGSSDHLVPCAVGGVNPWRPIETAPKHTEVLCWREDQGVFISQLTTPDGVISTEEMERGGYEFPDDFEEWWNAVWGWQEGSEKPTHWMPLPPPPARGNDAPTSQINPGAAPREDGHG